MDKNSFIGLVLISAILLGWYLFFQPKPPVAETQTPANPTEIVKGNDTIMRTDTLKQMPDSTREKQQVALYGDFGKLAVGENAVYTAKTAKYNLEIQSKGGDIHRIQLNDHATFEKKPVDLIVPGSQNFHEEFVYDNHGIRTDELYFQPVGNTNIKVSGKDSATLTLRASLSEGHFLEKNYTFYGNEDHIRYQYKMVGLEQGLKNNFYGLQWEAALPRQEKVVSIQRQKTNLIYGQSDGVEKMSATGDAKEETNGTVKWVSYRSQFFTYAIVPQQAFHKGDFEIKTPTEDAINKTMKSRLSLDIKRNNEIVQNFNIVMAPNEFSILRKYNMDPIHSLDLGWGPVKYINVATTYIFKWLEGLHISYGIIIFIFGILVKVVVLPMTYKSFTSMSKLRVLNTLPEMKELEKKYENDASKLQVEKMAIYNKMGVSPFGGCLPMILQYPIIISMFFFFPQAVELRGKSFLWAMDLSTYDSIWDFGMRIPGYGDHVSLFTILMAVSTFFFTLYTQSSQPTAANPAMQAQMKIMTYVMPFILLAFLNDYASGLTWYYFISNILAIAQNQLFRYFIDDKKLELKLIEAQKSRAKSPAKGGLQKWLDDAQKRQKEVQNQSRKDQNGTTTRKDRRN